jgi:hypothetical protein
VNEDRDESAEEEPTHEIKRPGGEWQDDDGGPWPVGTLTRRKVRRRPGVRTRVRLAILRVSGVTEPDANGEQFLEYEKAGEETIEFAAAP